MSNFDLLFTQDKQKVTDQVLDGWVNLTDYSVDSLSNNQDSLSIELDLPLDLVDGRFSKVSNYVPEDESNILEILNYRNKMDVGEDPIALRTFYLRDRTTPVSIWEEPEDITQNNYTDYIKIHIEEPRVKIKSSGALTRVEYVDVIIGTPVTEGNIVISGSEDLSLYDLNINFYLNFNKTVQEEQTFLLDDGSYETRTEDLNHSRLVRDGDATVVVYGLPPGIYSISLIESENLISSTGFYVIESYLPTNNLSLKSSQDVSLKALAYSLLPLATEQQKYVVNGIVDRLSFYTSEFNTIGLPSSFKRDIPEATSSIADIGSIALFIYCLTESAKVMELERIKPLLGEMIKSLFDAYNLRSETLISTFDLEGSSAIEVDDLRTSIIGHMALINYLEFFYSETAHYIAGLLEVKLSSITSSLVGLKFELRNLNTNKFGPLLAWMFIWSIVLQNENSREVVKALMLEFYQEEPFESNEDNLIISIAYKMGVTYGFLEDGVDVDLSYWNPNTFLIDLGDRLYTEELKPNMLMASSLAAIYEDNLFKINETPFNTYIYDALSLRNLLFQKMVSMMPTNDPWFKPEALRPSTGNIGAILKASSDSMLPVLLRYMMLINGFDINQAQGITLDTWGKFLNRQRKLNENDFDYRAILSALSSLNSNSVVGIRDSLQSIDSSIQVTTLVPNPILVNNEEVTWTLLSEFISYAEENDPEGVYDIDGTFIPLTDILGVIYIEMAEPSKILSEAVANLKPTGTDIRYKIYSTFTSKQSTATQYAGNYNYS